MIYTLLSILAATVNFIGYVPYIRDILSGKVKPQRITWGIWTILTTIAAVNQIANGGGWSSLFFVSTSAFVSIVFVLSIKKGVGGFGKIDILSLATASLLFIYWVTARNTVSTTYIAVVIDGVGALPTILKTWKKPETETYIQWVLAAVAGLLTILSVPNKTLVLVIYPLYIFVFNSIIVGSKFFAESKLIKVSKS